VIATTEAQIDRLTALVESFAVENRPVEAPPTRFGANDLLRQLRHDVCLFADHVNAKLVYEALIIARPMEKLCAVVAMFDLLVHIPAVVANPKQQIAVRCADSRADHSAFHFAPLETTLKTNAYNQPFASLRFITMMSPAIGPPYN
jgi:hypothetical protein